MDKDLEAISPIKRKEIDENNFLKSLLDEALKLDIIGQEEIQNIEIKLLELLKIRVEKYNGIDSSSIRNEKARGIMESNIFTIGIYLKTLTPMKALEELSSEPIEDLFNKGRSIIKRKVSVCRLLYKKILKNKLDTKNYTYNATLTKGIEGFFKLYNLEFEADVINITADYPLYNNLVGKLSGIEFIEKYLYAIYYENKFCSIFKMSDIEGLLHRHNLGYEDLIINIFQIVLTQKIALSILNRENGDLLLSKDEFIEIYNKLKDRQKLEIYKLVYNEADKIGKTFKDDGLLEYIKNGISEVQYQIYNLNKINKLDRIFITKKGGFSYD